jgi:hypothetical protein
MIEQWRSFDDDLIAQVQFETSREAGMRRSLLGLLLLAN